MPNRTIYNSRPKLWRDYARLAKRRGRSISHEIERLIEADLALAALATAPGQAPGATLPIMLDPPHPPNVTRIHPTDPTPDERPRTRHTSPSTSTTVPPAKRAKRIR